MITSGANARVKQVVQWQSKARERKKDGVFLAEGLKMYEEVPEERIAEVYLSQSMAEKLAAGEVSQRVGDKLWRTAYETVAEDVFAKMSDTQSPQGILTVVRRPCYGLEDLMGEGMPLIMVLENIQDPGNLGTILRTGEGAGITGVIICGKTVDIFNPKTIRATMGSIYRVPFLYMEGIGAAAEALRQRGICSYAADLKSNTSYDSYSYREPTAFLIGNEGKGLTQEALLLSERYLRIPMEGQVESLNAAVAAALLMYEAHRQRRERQGISL